MEMIKKMMIVLAILVMFAPTATAIELSINDYEPKPAESGSPVDVWFKIENPSDITEKEVYIEVTPKDSLRLTSGEPSRKRIGLMPPFTSQTERFRFLVADDAFEGSHKIEVSIITGIVSIKKELSIEVKKKDLKEVDLDIGYVESDPSAIKPGDKNVKLDVIILNLGDGKAQSVKTELTNLPENIIASESYSSSSLLGNIEADSTATATFYIDVDEQVSAGEYTAMVKTKYKYKPDEDEDEYLSEEKMIPLTISVKPVPLYEITKVELDPEILTAGNKDIKLRLTIKNTGEQKGESVRIKAYGKTEQPITFEKSSDFIAPSLNPGEEGQGTLEFKIDDDANLQDYYLDIEIKNIVDDDVITYNKKIPITISNAKPDNSMTLVIAAIAIIAAIFIARFIQKKRKKKEKASAKKIHGSYGKSYLDEIEGKKR